MADPLTDDPTLCVSCGHELACVSCRRTAAVPPGHHVVPDGQWVDGRVFDLVKILGAGWSLRGITIATSQEERSPRTDPVYRLVPVEEGREQ